MTTNLTVTFGETAKTLVAALKLMCAHCRALPLKPDPVARSLVVAQQTDANVAWLELSVVVDFEAPAVPWTHGPKVVESKLLAAALRGVGTLKDTLTLSFGESALLVRTTTAGKAADGVVETSVPYQKQDVYFMDASPCRTAENLVAGRTTQPIKELESMIKDAIAATSASPIVRIQVHDGQRVTLGEHAMEDVVVMPGAAGYVGLFDPGALQAFVKSTLGANEVSLQLYRDLPLKLMYSLFGAKKRSAAAKKKAAAAAAPPPAQPTATLEVYIAPRS